MGETKKDKILYGLVNSNIYKLFVLKKTEKISEAVFLISRQAYQSVIFKDDLEKRALLLLSNSLENIPSNMVDPLKRELILLASFLELGGKNTLISFKNALIVSEECYRLIAFMDTYHAELSGSLIFNDHYFEMDDLRTLRDKTDGWSLPRQGMLREDESRSPSVTTTQVKGQKKNTSNMPAEDHSAVRHSERRKNIISLVAKQGPVSIKDIMPSFTDCSEKTIQRELGVLIEEGVLKRQGKRRWSVYMLANSV
jgi:hypothetical protein